jgi:serine/threonine protein kinase
MKVIEKTNQNDEALNNEISALTEVTEYLNEHTDMQPYVTSLLANPTVAGNSLFLVSPFFANGEFEDALAEWDEYGGFPAMYGFMLHVAKGVAAMHEAGWVHGDLKFANAMISCVGESKAPRDCHAAVIDLGLACRTAEANCEEGVLLSTWRLRS